ncbi:Rgg/GadR/MutR family transcriptional regulator [Streptococcus pantholopis]|uniref:MutR family transcriptional regulator n=1 Tax=Streptococcus pantholopis TaxID=1811193 RepID=A0A172Q9N8_9STRE|nr:Rgg/GadR/MutR family transcriptional regulator [Streptococcus pantholopis]AND80137.1 MutR family transcriptional regulator [Streptococcus pantholopis]
MNEKKSMALGELYKELRMARGLRLKDIAQDNLSMPQLSRFENGQTMLAADKLLLAISAIHMSFAEFGHAVNNYETTDFFRMGSRIMNLHQTQDIEGLKQLLQDYKDYETYDVYNRLNLLVIKDSIHSLDNSYTIEKEEEEFLTQYLYSIEEWTEYELYIFGNTMTFLSDEDLIFLAKAFVERDKFYKSIPSHDNTAKLTLLNLIAELIERKAFYYVSYFTNILEGLVTYQDMFIITTVNFFKLMVTYIKGEQKNKQKIRDYLSALETLGDTQLADFFAAKFRHYTKLIL